MEAWLKMKKTIKEFNVITQEESIIERDMTQSELEEYEKEQSYLLSIAEEIEAITTAKEALLAKLGITAEEAKLLLS